MAHSNDRISKPSARRQVDLFDPHRAARRSPPPTTLRSPTTLGTPSQTAHPLGVPTASSPGGIRPFQPGADNTVGHAGYSHQPRTQRPASSTAQSLKVPPTPSPSSPQVQAARKSGRRPPRRGVRSPDFRYVVAGGSIVAGLMFVGDVTSLFQEKPVSNVCREIVQPDAVLSRETLLQLLAIPERNNKAAVRQIVNEPYCVLPSMEIRADATAEREAYPLAFDPQTWLVLLYEGDEYAGYSFSFQP